MAAKIIAYQNDNPDSHGAALRAIASRLLHLADCLDDQRHVDESILTLALCERDQIVQRIWAEAEYRARRKRADFFDEDLFGEPAWDMLLDLFIQEAKRKRTSVSSVCKASAVPDTTGLRWLGVLVERGLVERSPAVHDKRVEYVQLTENGIIAVSKWLRYRAALPV